MKILSIDPGYERLGIAILDSDLPEKECLVFSECFRTSADDEHPERLALIEKHMQKILTEHSPTDLAIENLFFNNNQKTALKVSEVRGLIIGIAKSAGLSVAEYTPPQIKVAVTGDGRSDKKAIIKMIPLLVKIQGEIKFDDEYDAIACGLTHMACKKEF